MTTATFSPDSLRGFTDLDDTSDDAYLRLPNAHRVALRRLLGRLSYDDLTARGLTDEQRTFITEITNSLD
jgi:hypothetical protein